MELARTVLGKVAEVANPMTYPPNEQVNVNAAGEPVAYTRTSPMTPIIRTVWLLFGVLIALLGIRILFLALGANEGNVIVDSIYAITDPFVAPFRGIFSIDQVRPSGQNVFDVAALLAIIGWTLVALLITAVLRIPDRSAA
jgi:uncharacterized protein YggT (Ycf19 family)